MTIGNHVYIGPNVGIYTVHHAPAGGSAQRGIMQSLPVEIHDNVWIGGNVVILRGVTIGEGAVIGAGVS